MQSVDRTRYPDLLDLIGNTPMVRLDKLCANPNVSLLGKLECYNPSFSIKDRIVAHIIQQAIKSRKITSDATTIEALSNSSSVIIRSQACL